MLGLGLVVAVMALLLAGTYKGLSSYIACMKTIDSKLFEVKEAIDLQEKIKALTNHGQGQFGELAELQQQIGAARDALQTYRARLEDTVSRGRDLDNGYKERTQVQALEEAFGELAKALINAQGPHRQLGEGTDNSPRDDPAVKAAIEKLLRIADDLIDEIYKCVGDRVESTTKENRHALIFIISTCVVGVLLMVWLLRFFYRWVFYPVRDLQEGAVRVAQGDFAHHIEVHSGDELERLADAFNYMTEQLADKARQLTEQNEDLARQVNERSRQLVRSERLASVGFLAAGVAHEINNPLASIAFCSEALEHRLAGVLAAGKRPAEGPGRPTLALHADQPAVNPEDSETIGKYLKMIQQEAFRCKEITQRLLEFSRGGERRREPTDLGEVVQSVLDVVQHLQSCKGKQLLFEPAGRLVASVNAQEIKSVVLNIVVNALDSMDEGGTLAMRLGQHDGTAEMVFADTGCGMTAEVLENIFEPFFTRSRTGKGTGLGLSISHRIISQHGGEIEATSPGPGQGSTFTVRLPLQPSQEQPEPQNPRAEDGDPELYFQDQRAERRGRKAA
jgi:signal transduction histidine kinase